MTIKKFNVSVHTTILLTPRGMTTVRTRTMNSMTAYLDAFSGAGPDNTDNRILVKRPTNQTIEARVAPAHPSFIPVLVALVAIPRDADDQRRSNEPID